MKAKYVKIINLIVALLVALFCIGQVFAWFSDSKKADELKFGGSSAGAYFAYGDGTATKKTYDDEDIPEGGDLTNWNRGTGPFGINSKYHMYNLAWLQDTGRLDKQYYFELDPSLSDNGLDMEDYWIPPIGNDTNKFEGIFNGNGKTIVNLKVTTDKKKLENGLNIIPARADYLFSNAVGLFGMTNEKSDISNFILRNPLVEAATQNTEYSATTASNKAIGIAVGHVAGACHSIGIYARDDEETMLNIPRLGYSTFNSIIGELAKGANSSVTGGGYGEGAGGSGNAFGSTFDVDLMLERMRKIVANNGASWRLTSLDTSTNDFPVPVSGDKIAFTVIPESEEGGSSYNGADAREVISDQNMGYFIGNQNKINRKRIEFTNDELTPPENNNDESYEDWTFSDGTTPLDRKKTPKWFYTNVNADVQGAGNPVYSSGTGFAAMSQEQYNDLPQDIKDLIVDDDDNPSDNKKDFMTVRFSNSFYLNGNDIDMLSMYSWAWSYYGQLSWNGSTYGEGFRAADGTVVNEDGERSPDMSNDWGGGILFNQYKKGVYLPNDVIWFKPARAGKFRFVMYSDEFGRTFELIRIRRTKATPENPFYIDWSSDVRADVVLAQNIISPYVLLYYEHDVSQDEIDAGNVEYFLAGLNGSGGYFVYLDIGASAAMDNSTVNREKNVSAIDFIYEGVRIAQKADEDSLPTNLNLKVGDFIVTTGTGSISAYEATQTSVYFEGLKNALQIVFIRLYSRSDNVTIDVDVRSSVNDALGEVTATNTNRINKHFTLVS